VTTFDPHSAADWTRVLDALSIDLPMRYFREVATNWSDTFLQAILDSPASRITDEPVKIFAVRMKLRRVAIAELRSRRT
jgi:hypothetical protein